MKFNISGADRDTSDDVELTIEAADEAAAKDIAYRKGIMVSRVTIAPATVTPPHNRLGYGSVALEQGHIRGAPTVNIAPPRRGSSLGVASLILGILAFLICWIPLVNLLGVPLSALGLGLGIAGLLVAMRRKGASIGYPIAGTAICGLALFIAISMTGALVGGLRRATDKLVKDAERGNDTTQVTEPSFHTRPLGSGGTPAPDDDYTSSISSTPQTHDNPAPVWASAETPVRQGDVQVQVRTIQIGTVPLKDAIDGKRGISKDPLLIIQVEVTNVSETKKVDYKTWGGRALAFGTKCTLVDNFGNRYKIISFGISDMVVGAIDSESIYPGKSIQDVLVFEAPVSKAEYLNLELSASQFGGDGMLRIRIPASMIQR